MELILITGILSLLNIVFVQQLTGDTPSVRPESVDRLLLQPAAEGPQSLQEAIWGTRKGEGFETVSAINP